MAQLEKLTPIVHLRDKLSVHGRFAWKQEAKCGTDSNV